MNAKNGNAIRERVFRGERIWKLKSFHYFAVEKKRDIVFASDFQSWVSLRSAKNTKKGVIFVTLVERVYFRVYLSLLYAHENIDL